MQSVHNLLLHLSRKAPVSLYLDATGGISTIPDQNQRVWYYALMLPGPGKDAPALPVCGMLSNEHSIPPLFVFAASQSTPATKFMKWKLTSADASCTSGLQSWEYSCLPQEDLCYVLEEQDMGRDNAIHCFASMRCLYYQGCQCQNRKKTDDKGLVKSSIRLCLPDCKAQKNLFADRLTQTLFNK